MIGAVILWKALFLLWAISGAQGQSPVCTVPLESCGKVPPPVRDGYVMKGLVLNRDTTSFRWREEYYDPVNYRAKSMDIYRGVLTTTLYDYNLQLHTEYKQAHPGAAKESDLPSDFACISRHMGMVDPEVNQFGRYYDPTQRPVMYGINEVLGYGGPYPFSLTNRSAAITERGIQADAFGGCIRNNELSQTFYWTKDVTTNTGELTIPARIDSVGGYYITEADSKKIWKKQDLQKDIVWFELAEQLPFELFQAPPRMMCKSEHSAKAVPKLPNFFSARIETFITTEHDQGVVGDLTRDRYEEFWYDFEEKLIRQDFYPTDKQEADIKKLFKSDVPLTAVYDFNTGVAYFTDQTNGICFPKIIPDWVPFADKTSDGVLHIREPQRYWEIDDFLLSYKGKFMMRGIETDAWIGKLTHSDPKLLLKPFREVYFSTDGFHLEADERQEYNVPIRMTTILTDQYQGQHAFQIMESNIYKFKGAKPALSVYDISGCVVHHPRRSFLIAFEGKDRGVLEANEEKFLQAARVIIKDAANLGSPLRVQELKLFFASSDNTMRLSFTLMDAPTVVGAVPAPNKGDPLAQAVLNLKKVMVKYPLLIPLSTGGTDITVITSKPDSLREIDYEKNILIEVSLDQVKPTNAPSEAMPPKSWASAFSQHLRGPAQASPSSSSDDDNSGYSPGAVGGLAIGMLLIGLVFGISMMWYYSKRASRSDTEVATFGLKE